jgi:hypothetical protein
MKIGQRLALQRRRGFLLTLHVVDDEKNGPSAAISAVDQDRAIEIMLEKGKYLAVSSLATHRTQQGLRNLFERRKQASLTAEFFGLNQNFFVIHGRRSVFPGVAPHAAKSLSQNHKMLSQAQCFLRF